MAENEYNTFGTVAARDQNLVPSRSDTQTITVTDVISEGPIQGLKHGEASIFLNDRRLRRVSDAQELPLSEATSLIGPFTDEGTTAAVVGYDLTQNTDVPNEKRIIVVRNAFKPMQVKFNTNFTFHFDEDPSGNLTDEEYHLDFQVTPFNAGSGFLTAFRTQMDTSNRDFGDSTLTNGRSLLCRLVPNATASSNASNISGTSVTKHQAVLRSLRNLGLNEYTGQITIISDNSTSAQRISLAVVPNIIDGAGGAGGAIYDAADPHFSRLPAPDDYVFDIEFDLVLEVSSFNAETNVITFGGAGTQFADGWEGDYLQTGAQLNFYDLGTVPNYTLAATEIEGEISDPDDSISSEFRTGLKNQTLLSSDFGPGATALTSNPNFDMEKGNTLSLIATATGSGELGISSSLVSTVDALRIEWKYRGGFYNIDNQGEKQPATAAYQIKLFLARDAANRTTFQDEFIVKGTLPGANAGFTTAYSVLHFFKSVNSTVVSTTIDLNAYQPFVNFKIEIIRTTETTGSGYASNLSRYPSSGDQKQSQYVTGSISNITAVIREKLYYPYTALGQVSFSSKEYDRMPSRSFECRGLLVRVPSNYITREEAGTNQATYKRNVTTGTITTTYQDWDGNFRKHPITGRELLVYTNNPAWIYYDILVNNRYGLGDFIKDTDIDKFTLYRIGRYCDELVPDGNGGTEPRYTMNTYLTKAVDAFKVLKDMATNFLGIMYYIDGKIDLINDAPSGPVYTFSKANTIDGAFQYETDDEKDRPNQIYISWNNPAKNFALDPLIVEDHDNIAQTGRIISTTATAFGCTSEGQATRFGKWKLFTAAQQNEIVSFKTGIQGSFIRPGDIINVQDSARYAVRYSGRVSLTGTLSATTIPLDSGAALNANSQYFLSLISVRPAAFATSNITINDTSGTPIFYKKGDAILQGYVGGTGSSNYVNIDTETEASNLTDHSGNDINVIWKEYFHTEELPVSGGINTSGTTVSFGDSTNSKNNPATATAGTYNSLIVYDGFSNADMSFPILNTSDSPDFGGAEIRGDVWGLREVATGSEVQGSLKQYKVLSLIQAPHNEYEISAVEHFNQKFTAVEEEFSTYIDDALSPPVSPTEEVPAVEDFYISSAVYNILPNGQRVCRVTLSWIAPSATANAVANPSTNATVNASLTSEYEHLAGFKCFSNQIGDDDDWGPKDGTPFEAPSVLRNKVVQITDDSPDTCTFAIQVRNSLGNLSIPKTVSFKKRTFQDGIKYLPRNFATGGVTDTPFKYNSPLASILFVKANFRFKPPQRGALSLVNDFNTNAGSHILPISNTTQIQGTLASDFGTAQDASSGAYILITPRDFVLASSLIQGETYTINTAGNTNWTSIGAADANPGTSFTKNSTSATGTGTAIQTTNPQFIKIIKLYTNTAAESADPTDGKKNVNTISDWREIDPTSASVPSLRTFTGTAAMASGNTSKITGTDTKFTEEFTEGDFIQFESGSNVYIFNVTFVRSDTVLFVDSSTEVTFTGATIKGRNFIHNPETDSIIARIVDTGSDVTDFSNIKIEDMFMQIEPQINSLSGGEGSQDGLVLIGNTTVEESDGTRNTSEHVFSVGATDGNSAPFSVSNDGLVELTNTVIRSNADGSVILDTRNANPFAGTDDATVSGVAVVSGTLANNTSEITLTTLNSNTTLTLAGQVSIDDNDGNTNNISSASTTSTTDAADQLEACKLLIEYFVKPDGGSYPGSATATETLTFVEGGSGTNVLKVFGVDRGPKYTGSLARFFAVVQSTEAGQFASYTNSGGSPRARLYAQASENLTFSTAGTYKVKINARLVKASDGTTDITTSTTPKLVDNSASDGAGVVLSPAEDQSSLQNFERLFVLSGTNLSFLQTDTNTFTVGASTGTDTGLTVSGPLTANDGVTVDTINLDAAKIDFSGVGEIETTGDLTLDPSSEFVVTPGGTEYLRLRSNGNLRLGGGHDTASPGSATLELPQGTGTNTAGGTLNIFAGGSTGSGESKIIFKTAEPNSGGSATATNSYSTRAEVTTAGVDISGTVTATGVVTANAGVVVDNITIDGTEIDLSSGDLILDAAGGIVLDADDSGTISFKDDGTRYGLIQKISSDSDFEIQSTISDIRLNVPDGYNIQLQEAGVSLLTASRDPNGDNVAFTINEQDKNFMIFGFDGGSSTSDRIIALDIDMAVEGNATFNGRIGLGGTTASTTYLLNYENPTSSSSSGNLLYLKGSGSSYNGGLQSASFYGLVGIFNTADQKGIQFSSSGNVLPADFTVTGFSNDNSQDLGTSSNRWSDAFVVNGVTTGSDMAEKQDIRLLNEAEKRVAIAAKSLLKVYRWKDRVAIKGDDARLHFGIMAQELQAAFEAEGLDAGDYGMFMKDTWDADPALGREAGTRYGVRYTELLAFIIAST